jgi:homoserine O-acetyltransferase
LPQEDNTATRADYAAMVEAVDKGVGQILGTLDRLGLANNTIVIFTNDNGGEWLSDNRPLFNRKLTTWEGGIRVPALVRWPGRIPTGRVSDQVGITMDLSASIVAASGGMVPAQYEGMNLFPILEGRAPEVERTLYWRATAVNRNQRAVRSGDWKVMVDTGHVMVFDLRRDIGERNDLAYQRPDIARRLRPLLTRWEEQIDAEALVHEPQLAAAAQAAGRGGRGGAAGRAGGDGHETGAGQGGAGERSGGAPAQGSTPQGGRGSARYPAPVEGDFVLKDFRFRSGEVLPELKLHYRTIGKPARDAKGIVRNAVLVLHGTGGTGAQFLRAEFAGELFAAGALFDGERHFIILPDGIGHGGSSKPSGGLRARFPRYGYLDMVEAQYRLLTDGLGVNHLRLVMGTSMGGMHTWLWGQRHPDFMDALMPLASLPTQISGRNRVWRRVAIDAIRHDPEWRGGNYTTQPPSLRTAEQMLFLVGSNPTLRQAQMPTLEKSDATLDASVAASMKTDDANDVLYQLEASRDYDPGPGLEKIRAPLVAVNSADDLINPPELGILEREIKRVPRGRAVVVPFGPETRGHGTHTIAAVWKQYLEELLKSSTR